MPKAGPAGRRRLHRLWPAMWAMSAYSSTARPSEHYKLEMIHYQDVLSCCRPNGRINRAVRACVLWY